MLSLLQNSNLHHNALLKALDKAYVAQNISVEGIDQLVGNITIGAFIAFLDEKIPPEGKESTKALHITIKCKKYILQQLFRKWFIFERDTNVFIVKLPIDHSCMKKSQMVVRAFDETKRKVLGNIKLPVQIGPCTFHSKFIVTDINPSYNCLLERLWIYMAGAVPSTLHQKVKFVVDENLIIVVAG